MSPFSATTTPVGPLKCFSSAPATPASPSRISTLPSALNFQTWWPMPFLKPASPRRSPAGAPSVTQTLPSRSMKNPCGKLSSPLPKLATIFPSGSILMIGSRSDSAQPFAPQRSRIHMCRPSRSILIPLATPILRPSGLFQFGIDPVRMAGGLALQSSVDVRRIAATMPAAIAGVMRCRTISLLFLMALGPHPSANCAFFALMHFGSDHKRFRKLGCGPSVARMRLRPMPTPWHRCNPGRHRS